MMDNMTIYNKFRDVPAEAKKTIEAGRLKGFTDINPMWRIKMLTEQFGPCGVGWYTDDEEYWTETGADGRTAMYCKLRLYVKTDGEWSKGIRGIGGSMLVDLEKGNPRTSDEAPKMAYTDALGIACKALGMAANVYYAKDRTKYDVPEAPEEIKFICADCGEVLKPYTTADGKTVPVRKIAESSKTKYGRVLCTECGIKAKAAADVERLNNES